MTTALLLMHGHEGNAPRRLWITSLSTAARAIAPGAGANEHTAGMHPAPPPSVAAPPDPPDPPRLPRILACWLLIAAFVGVSATPAQAAPTHPDSPQPLAESAHALWQWPVHPRAEVTREFDLPHRYAAGHRGIDLAVQPGTQIQAVAAGTVWFVGRVVDRNVVSIQHANGLRSTYEPVDARVQVGDQVSAGTVIGTLSTTTIHSTNGGLHLGARIGDDYLDPLSLLQVLPPAVLLPLNS